MKTKCYCGHLHERHYYNEAAIGGWSPGDPEPELTFTHCGGMAPHGDEKQICPCKEFQQFPFGFYRHLKTGNVYEVTDLGFNHDTRTIEVEYRSVQYDEVWHRPMHSPEDGFFNPDAATGRPRFERISEEEARAAS